MDRRTRKKVVRIIKSLFGGIYFTATIYSVFHFMLTGEFFYLKMLGTPLLIALIASTIYMFMAEDF